MPDPASSAVFVAGAAHEQVWDRQVGHGEAGDREAAGVKGIGRVANRREGPADRCQGCQRFVQGPNRLAPLPVIDPAALFPGFEQAGLLNHLELKRKL